MIEFTFHQKGEAHHEHPRNRAAFDQRVQFKLSKAQAPFFLRRDEGPIGPDRTTAEVMDRVQSWTKQGKVGSRLDIVAQDTVFNLKTVQVAPPIQAPDIDPELKPVYIRGFTKHGYLTNLGNWFCRYVAGTNTVSTHGYSGSGWQGAAQDFGASTPAQLDQWADEVVHAAQDPQDTEFFNKVATVIVHDRIWERGQGWSHYGGIFHFHVHVNTDNGGPCSP